MILATFIGVFAFINADKLIDRFIRQQAESVDFRTDLLEAPGMSLITVGTGAPIPSERVQSCNVIFVNGQFLVFDLGRGAASEIEKLRLPQQNITAVFISHWHSDHFMDLPHLINRSWQMGRANELPIYGPKPIDSILGGMRAMMHMEQHFREIHHGQEIMDQSLANGKANIIATEANIETVVYQKDGVVVTAFEVEHDPISPSLGFKISYEGKSIVLSGDTKKSEQVIKFSKGADILVHEAMQKDFILRAAELQKELGNTRNATMLYDIVDYHTTPLEAAEVADAANVKKLILSHLAPAPENTISRRFFTRGLDEVYSGPILLAEDGDIYTVN